MSAKNIVIAGDYEKSRLMLTRKGAVLTVGFLKTIPVNKSVVEGYEVMGQEQQTSVVSAIGRGLAGHFFLGPIGAVAALSAKKKGAHVVAIQFKDGKRSLLELDDKHYKQLMTDLF